MLISLFVSLVQQPNRAKQARGGRLEQRRHARVLPRQLHLLGLLRADRTLLAYFLLQSGFELHLFTCSNQPK